MQTDTRTCFFAIVLLTVFFLPLFPCTVLADQQTISVGYGLGTLSNGKIGHLQSGDYYDYGQITYGYEKTISGKFNLLVEPFAAFVNRPDTGLDVGVAVGGRYYFGEKNHRGFFATISGGGAYTTVKFEDQGTHCLFVLQGGIGYKWEKLFVEARFKHYSNGGFSSPNRSLNSTMVGVGCAF